MPTVVLRNSSNRELGRFESATIPQFGDVVNLPLGAVRVLRTAAEWHVSPVSVTLVAEPVHDVAPGVETFLRLCAAKFPEFVGVHELLQDVEVAEAVGAWLPGGNAHSVSANLRELMLHPVEGFTVEQGGKADRRVTWKVTKV